ncbi:MAG: T9SS type A sorting domain-containing protein, partial [Candidatus Latescibacteria bacterium]|nr:T9SS type A sorting domain-containing protein [Candidatus Latescibacterota bacterium]
RQSEFAAIAVSGNNVYVVWHDQRNQTGSIVHADIFFKYSRDGGTTWSNDTQLTYQPVATRSVYASIAVAGDTVHLVWEDYRDDLSGEIYYKRSLDGGITWGSDVRLTYSANFASWWPSIAVSGQNIHVVFRDSRDGAAYNHEIYYKRSLDGGANWGSDIRLTTTTAESWNPSIAVVGDTVHVAWNDGISYPNNSHEIYYKRSLDNGTTWSQNIRLSYSSVNSYFASVAAKGSNVHIVWQEARPGPSNDIYYIHSINNGMTWSSDTNLTNLSTSQKYLPGVAVADANVHVLWRDLRDYSTGEMYYKRYLGIPPSYYTITATADGPGIIIPSGYVMVNIGTDTTFTITPNANCQLDSLVVDNINHGADSTYYTFYNVTTDHTISAYFSPVVDIEEPDNDYPLLSLQRIYPNPFKNQTTIQYQLTKSAPVRIKIYNCLGSEVRTLVDGHQTAGTYTVNWNGKDNKGRSVGNGLYIIRIIAESESSQHRLLLIR